MKAIAGSGIRVYEDESVSAFSIPFRARPAASRLFADLKEGDHVIIFRTDRAFRNIRDAVAVEQELRDRGVTLHLTRDGIRTDNEHGRMFFHVLAIFSELESSIKRRRKLETNEWLRGQGRPTNTLPRHHKTITVGGTKKLTHDLDMIQDVFVVWVLREAGLTWVDANNYMFAIRGARQNKTPVLARSKRRKSKDCIVVSNLTIASRMVSSVSRILNEVPDDLAKDLIQGAIEAVKIPVDPKYLSHCLFGHRFPVVDIEHRLASREIDPQLAHLLPSHSQCASVPA
jgi:hypothetical protein